jgi:succinate-acetate transporter protein
LLLLVCTIRTSWVFFSLFLTLDLAFFFLAVGHFVESGPGVNHVGLIKTGGFFGLLAAFLAWYVALVQVADSTNHFIKYPMFEFPWNPARQKTARDNV